MSKRKNKNPASSAAKVIADICGDPSIEKEIKRRIKKGEAVVATHKLKVWMLKNNAGQYLCYRNLNRGLRYHFSFPFDSAYLEAEKFCFCATRWMARNLADDVHENLRNFVKSREGFMKGDQQFLKNTHVKPVQVEISWREL